MKYLILGSGLVGRAAANLLSGNSESVTVISKSGRKISDQIKSLALDVTDEKAWQTLDIKVDAVINALNPVHYYRWPVEFPPLGKAANHFALTNGIPIVSVSNLYMYDASKMPISVDSPVKNNGEKSLVRQKMWESTEELMAKGLQAAEVRASDYMAAGDQSPLGDRFIPKVLNGKSVSVIGNPNALHSWTAPVDVARTAIKVLEQKKFGRVWHVPTNPPKSFQQVADEICEIKNLKKIKVKSTPDLALSTLALFIPIVKAIKETIYQFEKDFVIDSDETQQELKIGPSDWHSLLSEQIKAYE